MGNSNNVIVLIAKLAPPNRWSLPEKNAPKPISESATAMSSIAGRPANRAQPVAKSWNQLVLNLIGNLSVYPFILLCLLYPLLSALALRNPSGSASNPLHPALQDQEALPALPSAGLSARQV